MHKKMKLAELNSIKILLICAMFFYCIYIGISYFWSSVLSLYVYKPSVLECIVFLVPLTAMLVFCCTMKRVPRWVIAVDLLYNPVALIISLIVYSVMYSEFILSYWDITDYILLGYYVICIVLAIDILIKYKINRVLTIVLYVIYLASSPIIMAISYIVKQFSSELDTWQMIPSLLAYTFAGLAMLAIYCGNRDAFFEGEKRIAEEHNMNLHKVICIAVYPLFICTYSLQLMREIYQYGAYLFSSTYYTEYSNLDFFQVMCEVFLIAICIVAWICLIRRTQAGTVLTIIVGGIHALLYLLQFSNKDNNQLAIIILVVFAIAFVIICIIYYSHKKWFSSGYTDEVKHVPDNNLNVDNDVAVAELIDKIETDKYVDSEPQVSTDDGQTVINSAKEGSADKKQMSLAPHILFCRYCGASIESESCQFCRLCGKELIKKELKIADGIMPIVEVKVAEEIKDNERFIIPERIENKDNQGTVDKNTNAVYESEAEQLRELKHLQEEGLITQEDYDAKKRQLLGL